MKHLEVTTRQICLASVIWMALVSVVIFIPNISPWIATPVALIGIIFVPGFLWAINLKLNPDKILEYILYSIGLGLGFVLIGGLGINWLFPYVGILQPLAKLPLVIFFDISVLVLSVYTYLFNKEFIFLRKSSPSSISSPDKANLFFGIIPLLFVVASVCGAEILNNGGTGTITLIMLFAIAFYVLALMLSGKSVHEWIYVSAIYFISLSLLLMYSLRSAHILGWDINQEYQVFQMTLQNLRWKMSYYPGLDYNACISITILPTIFKELTNIASEYVFKVTFQLLFAVVPVMVYALAKRYLKEALAFLAAFLLVSQTWFFEQMPGLIRQETAFLFFAAVLLLLFDRSLTSRTRYILFYVFTFALILSHYSTAYVWLALLLVVLALSYIVRLFAPSLRRQSMVITPLMFLISLLMVFIWQVPLTNTAGNIANFITGYHRGIFTSSLLHIVKADTASATIPSVAIVPTYIATSTQSQSGLINMIHGVITEVFFAGGNANTNQNVALDEQKATELYGKSAGYEVYPNTTITDYVPTAINDNRYVSPKLPASVSSLLNFGAWISKLLFVDLFPIIGMVGMYFLLRRRSPSATYDFILFGIGAYGLIVLMIFIPYAQEYYNFTRLYLQMFIILSTFAVVGGVAIMKYFPRYQMFVLALMAIILFCSLNGAFDQLTGGQARLTLDQPPSTLDTYYIYDAEIAGARWLARNRAPHSPVQADDVANLRLQSFGNINANNTAIFPQTIEQSSYVYLMGENIIRGTAFSLYNNNLLTYNYPLAFLNSNKNLIYNDGGSRIYR